MSEYCTLNTRLLSRDLNWLSDPLVIWYRHVVASCSEESGNLLNWNTAASCGQQAIRSPAHRPLSIMELPSLPRPHRHPSSRPILCESSTQSLISANVFLMWPYLLIFGSQWTPMGLFRTLGSDTCAPVILISHHFIRLVAALNASQIFLKNWWIFRL